jgi:hypothetical protein
MVTVVSGSNHPLIIASEQSETLKYGTPRDKKVYRSGTFQYGYLIIFNSTVVPFNPGDDNVTFAFPDFSSD